MKKSVLLTILALVTVLASVLAGCGDEETAEPWPEFASIVSDRINVAEDTILETLEKAIEEGIDIGGDDTWARLFSEIDYDELVGWYENRPEGLTLEGLFSFRYYGVRIEMLRSGSEKLLDGLARKVASELDLSPPQVIEVFHDVMRELEDSRHKETIDEMVSDGALTREQGDRYYAWFLLRPESIAPGRIDTIE